MDKAEGKVTNKEMYSDPSVSVIIPSYQRHEELIRAVKSVQQQSLAPLEIIIINDGVDEQKGQLLAQLHDKRIRYFEAPRRANASATRNYGVRHALGEWVALLDDDDVWLPNKLFAQFEALSGSAINEAVISGVERVINERGEVTLRPAEIPSIGTEVGDLLFGRWGGLHTSTLLAPRKVFQRNPFNESLDRHEDWTWLLQVGQELPIIVAAEEICERHLRSNEGLSRTGGFVFSRNWYLVNCHALSSKARVNFIAKILARKAAYDMKFKALPWLLRECFCNGGGLRGMARLLLAWTLPGRSRDFAKSFMMRLK